MPRFKMNLLLELNQSKLAEKLVNKRIRANKDEKSNYLLLAKLYKKEDNKKKIIIKNKRFEL